MSQTVKQPETESKPLSDADSSELIERTYRAGLSKCEVPVHLHEGLLMYLLHRLRPGSFLTAVLEDKLRQSLAKADPTSRRMLHEIVGFLYEWAPHDSHGSVEAVDRWVKGTEVAS